MTNFSPIADGTILYVGRDGHLRAVTAPNGQSFSPADVRQFLCEIGKLGGQARAQRHSREELAAWGRVRHRKGAKFSKDDVPSDENKEPSS